MKINTIYMRQRDQYLIYFYKIKINGDFNRELVG